MWLLINFSFRQISYPLPVEFSYIYTDFFSFMHSTCFFLHFVIFPQPLNQRYSYGLMITMLPYLCSSLFSLPFHYQLSVHIIHPIMHFYSIFCILLFCRNSSLTQRYSFITQPFILPRSPVFVFFACYIFLHLILSATHPLLSH